MGASLHLTLFLPVTSYVTQDAFPFPGCCVSPFHKASRGCQALGRNLPLLGWFFGACLLSSVAERAYFSTGFGALVTKVSWSRWSSISHLYLNKL